MQYRKFGKLDWQVSALGFGAMRLPIIGGKVGQIDEEQSTAMIRYAIDHGVNYIDTAYPYHEGHSEGAVGKALKNGYRERVKIATKLPSWMTQSTADFDKYLEEQLRRLDVDKIDFYLLHGLGHAPWNKLKNLGVLKWAESQMAQGKIGKLGFSFHDNFDAFKEIVDGYDNWTLCQIQMNYMDINFQSGLKGLKYGADKGLAVVVMEPLRGGGLVKRPPESVKKIWGSAAIKRSPAEWGLLWVWDRPEVSVVLSGMSKMEQVVENIATAEKSRVGLITAKEQVLFDKAREAWKALSPSPCTGCGYCQPCPQGVVIPMIMEMYNNATIYDDPTGPSFFYGRHLAPNQRANMCTECGECMKVCPQGFDIPGSLKKAHALIGPKQ